MKRILIADDNETIRFLTQTTLELLGDYEVVAATDGQDAQAKFLDGSFDLVITDLDMPNVNGAELVRWIRAQAGGSDVPVIVLTAMSDEKRRAQLVNELRVQHFLVKPFDPVTLGELVGKVLG